jgi:tripartite-type tricarboxylate transporter receptor subunit TctC
MDSICRRAFMWGALGFATSTSSFAQEFPGRPVRLVLPSAAGSLNDVISRVLQPELTRILGQPVVIENMPGAAGILATRYVTKQPPDGYTLLAIQTTNTVASIFVKDPGYDMTKDLAPVVIAASTPILLIANQGMPFNTFADMVAYAKANPGKLNHGLPGPTDLFALYMGAIKSRYGINIVDVPYKSSPAYHVALSANEVQLAFTGIGNAMPLMKTQRAKALAISGDKRDPAYPDVPTFTEAGVPAIEELKFMTFAPAGTPKTAIDRINAAYVNALAQPEVKSRISNLNVGLIGSTPAALGSHLGPSLERYALIAKTLGIKPE